MLLGLHMDQLALKEPDFSSCTSIPPGPKSFLFDPPSLEMHLETACVFTGGYFTFPQPVQILLTQVFRGFLASAGGIWAELVPVPPLGQPLGHLPACCVQLCGPARCPPASPQS